MPAGSAGVLKLPRSIWLGARKCGFVGAILLDRYHLREYVMPAARSRCPWLQVRFCPTKPVPVTVGATVLTGMSAGANSLTWISR